MRIVEIEAANRCNAHCLHCPREAITRPQGVMSREVFQTVADKILQSPGFEAVYFSGMGEPTLNPSLPRFVAYLSEKLPVSLTTNVFALTPARVQELIEAGLSSVVVSFNGHNAELYESMMGGLSFEKASQRVRDLVHLGEGKLSVSANVSVTPQTRLHLPKIKDYLESLGIHEIIFAMCHSRGGYLRDPSICDTPMPSMEQGRCDIFADTLFVAWNGQVLACCHDLEGKGRVGDLVTEKLDDVLDRKRRVMRQGLWFPMCENCNDMYRFIQDPTPDGSPLSEWIYLLSGGEGQGTAQLVDTIVRLEARIQELESLIARYEGGRFIRFAAWLHSIKQKLTGRARRA